MGSRFARRIPWGARTVELAITSRYEGTDHIEAVWGAAGGPSAGGSAEFPIAIDVDSGEFGGISLEFPRVMFDQVNTRPSGRAEIEQQLTAHALIGSATLLDASKVETEVLATIQNDRGTLIA